jgi:hypothetical protein
VVNPGGVADEAALKLSKQELAERILQGVGRLGTSDCLLLYAFLLSGGAA